MAVCNKSSILNILNDTTKKTKETEKTKKTKETDQRVQREKMIRKGKCSDYRSFKPNSIDILEDNLGKITYKNSNKNIENTINDILLDKPHDKTVENYRNIVEGFISPAVAEAEAAAEEAEAAAQAAQRRFEAAAAREGVTEEEYQEARAAAVRATEAAARARAAARAAATEAAETEVAETEVAETEAAAGEGADIPNSSQSATDGVKNILILIISGIISVFIFALFVFGPFVFWSMHAPNKMYSEKKPNPCYENFTILERFFPFKRDEVPYNWRKAKKYKWCYDKKDKPPSISVDTCMNNRLDVSGTGKLVEIISKLESLLRGFPYNIIIDKNDNKWSIYRGEFLLIFTLFVCSLVGSIIYHFRGAYAGNDDRKGLSIGIGIFGIPIVIIAFTYCLNWMHLKMDYMKITIAMVGLFVITTAGNIVSAMLEDSWPVVCIIATILTFAIYFIISRFKTTKIYPSNNCNNTTIPSKPVNFNLIFILPKMFYLFRKTIAYSYIGNVRHYRKTHYSAFKQIGKIINKYISSPVYTILFVFFGSVFIPIITGCITIWAILVSFFHGLKGAFSRSKKMKDAFVKKNLQQGGATNQIPDDIYTTQRLYNSFERKILCEDPNDLSTRFTALFLIFPTGILLVLNIIFSAFNTFISGLIYEFIPLLYPPIMATIFKCNVKYLIIIFGSSMLGTLWYYQNNKDRINFGLTDDILGWMTVTFIVLSFLTLRS